MRSSSSIVTAVALALGLGVAALPVATAGNITDGVNAPGFQLTSMNGSCTLLSPCSTQRAATAR